MWRNFQFTDIWRRFVSVSTKRFLTIFWRLFKFLSIFTTKLNMTFAYQFIDWHTHRKIEKIRFHISLWQNHFLKRFFSAFFLYHFEGGHSPYKPNGFFTCFLAILFQILYLYIYIFFLFFSWNGKIKWTELNSTVDDFNVSLCLWWFLIHSHKTFCDIQ